MPAKCKSCALRHAMPERGMPQVIIGMGTRVPVNEPGVPRVARAAAFQMLSRCTAIGDIVASLLTVISCGTPRDTNPYVFAMHLKQWLSWVRRCRKG